MRRPSNDLPRVYLCRDVVDFRKGIKSLSVLVEATLALDPFSEHLFVFCNRKRDKVKVCCIGNAMVFACGKRRWNKRGSSGRARHQMRS